jgi:hypothetical protein
MEKEKVFFTSDWLTPSQEPLPSTVDENNKKLQVKSKSKVKMYLTKRANGT